MNDYDLIVVGAGAAGLMACASAIRHGKSVLLLEKNNKLGVKILMSGGTRCNITHACDRREIVSAFGDSGRFLHSALASLSPDDVVHLIESVGVATKVEAGGKIFPVSNRSVDVRDALVDLATDPSQSGSCKIITNQPCRNISKAANGDFSVVTDSANFQAASVLLTTGGKSYPGCGTTGDGYPWASAFGHRIVTPVAALTPIVNSHCWTHQLKGITFDHVQVKVIESPTNRVLDHRIGAFLFTHFGYSGPSVLDVSRSVSRSGNSESLILQCDFEPDSNDQQLSQSIEQLFREKSRHSLHNTLSSRYPKKFCRHLLESLKFDLDRKTAEVGKTHTRQLVESLKRIQFPIDRVFGFDKAEVTAGGISLDEIDGRTMESKICPGLYFAGEVIDLDGPIGGYNFQAAFSTGWLAGQHS